MNQANNATIIRRELMIELITLMNENKLVEKIDRIPIEHFPQNTKSVRCCIYKDRAMTKYRLMALLGFNIEDETDELKTLAEYAKEALTREEPTYPILTVLSEACSSCVQTQFFITNACRGCVARPCIVNCPKDVITMENGQAKIDSEGCVNCGICKTVCPYHAVIKIPIPCEEACPVDAITKDEFGKEEIDYDKCIFCGKCMTECPFGAIMEKSQLVDVLRKILDKEQKVVAMVAPSIIGQFAAKPGQVFKAIKELGFDEIVEVAAGADETIKHEAAEFEERMAEGDDFMTTSCCTAYTHTVKKHIPELAKRVSDTPTPMHYAANLVKEKWPQAKTVFIGPCIAKKQEAIENPLVDNVLSIEEIGSMFVAQNIDVKEMDSIESAIKPTKEGRGFPASFGVTNAVKSALTNPDLIEPVMVDGLDRKAIKLLKIYADGKMKGNFMECMSCEGGCIAGPAVIGNPKIAARELNKFIKE